MSWLKMFQRVEPPRPPPPVAIKAEQVRTERARGGSSSRSHAAAARAKARAKSLKTARTGAWEGNVPGTDWFGVFRVAEPEVEVDPALRSAMMAAAGKTLPETLGRHDLSAVPGDPRTIPGGHELELESGCLMGSPSTSHRSPQRQRHVERHR